jgi:hypothetical protein
MRKQDYVCIVNIHQKYSMHGDDESIDFAAVLGSTVHHLKNSLCLIMQSIENLGNSLIETDLLSKKNLASAHYEASRLITGLLQLLCLYRTRLDNLPLK